MRRVSEAPSDGRTLRYDLVGMRLCLATRRPPVAVAGRVIRPNGVSRPLWSPAQRLTRAGLDDHGEVADRLGVSLRRVYRIIDAGQRPAYKIGRLIRLRTVEVEAFAAGDGGQPEGG